jgi:protein-disulfide isomerase
MRFFLSLVLIFAGLRAAVAHEADLDARIRSYILEHPEVILEALEHLSLKEQKAALSRKLEPYLGIFEAPPILGLGDPDAPVRVVEFFDYKCVPCKAMHPKLAALVQARPELRIEMRQLPILTPGSERAARFALAVQQVAGAQAYGRVHSALWNLRGPLNSSGFRRIAEKQGLDYDQIAAQMQSAEISERIRFNRDMAIDLQLLGTPAFVTPDSVTFGAAEIEDLTARWLSQ